MAVTAISDMPRAREVIETTVRSARVSRSGVDIVRTWSVSMPSKDDGPVGVLLQPEIPRRGTPHPQEPFAYLDDIIAVEDQEDELTFLVTGRYTTVSASGAEPEINPLLRSLKYVLTDTTTQEDVAVELDGKDVTNSSREPLFGASRPAVNEVFTITRNEANFPWGLLKTYRNSVNNALWFNFGAGEWLCQSITGESAFEAGIFFVPVSYRFEHNPLGWNRKIMDRGTRKINTGWSTNDPPEDRYTPLTGNDGRQFQGFTLLDGHGQPLGHEVPPVFLPVAGPAWKFHEPRNFGALNLE